MKRFDIDIHAIFKLFEDDLVEIAKLSIKTKNGEKTELGPRHMYVIKNFWVINEINHKLRDLDYCMMFMNSFPSIKSWRNKISHADYFIYHYEYYLSTSIGVFDRLLLYVNQVYDLGMNSKHVKLDILLENSKVDQNLKKALKEFDSYLQKVKLKKYRNMSSHSNKIVLEELKEAEQLEYVSKLQYNSKKERDQFKAYAKLLYRLRLNVKKKDWQRQIKEIDKHVENALDLLYPLIKNEYDTQHI